MRNLLITLAISHFPAPIHDNAQVVANYFFFFLEFLEHDVVCLIFVLSSTVWFLVEITRIDWTGNCDQFNGNTKPLNCLENTDQKDFDHNDNCFQGSLTADVGIINITQTK